MIVAVRIEWCKAYARKKRWAEEVRLLEEEQRRVLQTMNHIGGLWRERAATAVGGSELANGRRAYALRQEAWLKRLCTRFSGQWTAPTISGKRRRSEDEESTMAHADTPSDGVLTAAEPCDG
jgi:hypothetical protein